MSTRIVYSDLDGTMFGSGGSFFRASDGSFTRIPTDALLALHVAGVVLVLVSGRTRGQLVEATRIVAADGFVAELGALLAWDSGRSSTALTGDMPSRYAGRTPMDVMTELGVVDTLLAAFPGRLEWHDPWHVGHVADAMLRGAVPAAEVDTVLADVGCGWLVLADNGVLPPNRPTGLAPAGLPAHVYHLMPRGLSKGLAVAADLARRGLSTSEAIAIGDSASDLAMAPHVGRMWITANGAAHPHMPALIAAHDNVTVTDGAVGLGWAQAVLAALP